MGMGCLGVVCFNLCIECFAWYTLGREWPWISGSLSEPLSCDFLGIVTEGFTIPETVLKKNTFL